ncbi:MAG: hypothetical protein WA102_02195 [Candidatus Methanoperedens sp.]
MGKKGDKAGDKIIDLFGVFAIAIVVIYAGFSIVDSLIKTVPLWIQVIFGGLLVAFVYAIREEVIEYIKNIGK